MKPPVRETSTSTSSPKSNGLAALLGALCFCGIALYFFVPGLPQLHEWQELDRFGRTTVGTVVGHEKVTGKSTKTSLTCAYRVDGSPYTETEYVRPGFYDTVGVRDSITITYLPSNPASFRTPGSLKYSMATAGIVGGILCVAVAIGFVIRAIAYFNSNSS